jgi:hypothetical protein
MGFKVSDDCEINKNIIIIIIQRRKYGKELGKDSYKKEEIILKGNKRKIHSN